MIEPTNVWDALCNLCILIMENLSKLTGWSYGLVNILLFVILGPLSTLSFMLSSFVFSVKTANEKVQRTVDWTLFTIGAIIVLIVIGLISYAILELPLDFY